MSQGEYNASRTEKLKNLEIGNITKMKKENKTNKLAPKREISKQDNLITVNWE